MDIDKMVHSLYIEGDQTFLATGMSFNPMKGENNLRSDITITIDPF